MVIVHCASLDGQKAKVDAKKKIDIWQLPPVLVIHLKRGLAEQVRCAHGCPWFIPRYQKKWCSMICHDISIYSMSNTDVMLVYVSDTFIHIPCYGNPGWIMVGKAGIIAENLHKVIVVILPSSLRWFWFPWGFPCKIFGGVEACKSWFKINDSRNLHCWLQWQATAVGSYTGSSQNLAFWYRSLRFMKITMTEQSLLNQSMKASHHLDVWFGMMCLCVA